MKLIRTALLVSWISACMLSQVRAQGQDSAPDIPKHVVGGTVINSVTGSPISRALVELTSDISRYAMTDGNGVFRFDGVAEGSVKVEAERPGFFKPMEVDSERGASSDLQVDRDMYGIVLKLVPWAEIAIQVNSVKGSPIQDFPIRLYERRIVDGVAHWENTASVNSDTDGFCRVFGIVAGALIISGGPELWRPRPPGAKHLGYPLAFYPNGRELSGASVLTITAGQKVEVDFSLSQEPLFEVSGSVLELAESVDTKIELSSTTGDPVLLVHPHPAQHEFSGYATAGKYILRASAEVNGRTLRATLPLTISGNTTGIHVVLAPQMPIPVNVRSDFADAGRDRSAEDWGASVKLRSTSGLSSVELTATEPDGRNRNVLEVSGVEPGRYLVEIDSYGGYVKSALSGSTDLLQNNLLIPEDGSVQPIEIVLSKDGGEISGNVKMPDPNSIATVLLVPEQAPDNGVKTVITQAGAFRFEQVAPGGYLLFAFDRIKDLEYRNTEALGSYRSRGTQVEVWPRQHITTMLDVIEVQK